MYVEVEAASSVGKIIVNGVEKASHKGGYSLFRANVTDALHDGENLLAIWVDNTQRDDVYPQTADFTFYGGLYRGVNLITVEDSRFDLDYCGGKGFDVSAAVEDGARPLSLWTRSSQTPSRARALSSSSATPRASSWPAPCVRRGTGARGGAPLKTPTCGRREGPVPVRRGGIAHRSQRDHRQCVRQPGRAHLYGGPAEGLFPQRRAHAATRRAHARYAACPAIRTVWARATR